MKSVFSIWMQPVHARSNSDGRRLLWAFLGVFPLIAMVMASLRETLSLKVLAAAASIGLVAAALVLYVLWFMLLTVYAMQQYSAANAGLIPGLKRHMMWAFGVPILLTGVMAGAAATVGGHTSFALAWFCGVVSSVLWTSSIRNKAVIYVMAFGAVTPRLLEHLGLTPVFPALVNTLDHAALLFPLGALIVLAGLNWIFSLRGDSLFARKKHVEAVQIATDSSSNSSVFRPGVAGKAYSYLLNRALRKKPGFAHLLPFCFGPQLHWATTLLQTLLFVSLAPLFIFAFFHLDEPAIVQKQLYWFGIFPLLAVLFFGATTTFPTMLYQTQNEQGLLGLCEHSPAPQAFTRAVFGYFLRYFGVLWAASLLAAILTAGFLDVSPWLRTGIYLVCFALLPLAANVLANHATMHGPQDSKTLRTVAVSLVLALASLKLSYDHPGLPVVYLCAPIALGSAAFLLWRWRRLMRQAAVFPVGRAV